MNLSDYVAIELQKLNPKKEQKMAVKVEEFPKGILAEVTTTEDLNDALIALVGEYLTQQAEVKRIQLASQKIQKEYQEACQMLTSIQGKITPLLSGLSKTVL